MELVDELLEVIESRIQRFKSYLNVLDEFESRHRTTNRYYYLGRLDELEFMKEFLLQKKKR
jgi:hypothetical protein